MGFVKEFKDFAFKGNVVDLAVGVIIGAAFSAIVKSFVDDIITPLLLNPALEKANVKNIAELSWNGVKYGNFLSSVISFLIVAFVLFLLIKVISRLNRKEEVPAAPAGPTEDQKLLMEIRDLLKTKNNI
ncbi:large conductance mechanosensitive channel protein MscL [Chryseobacterium indoltheticum]|jgi:large conductance mechanosensitive channel|uniref:Large-conductance mechanosensitive channel n=1 Tax=Chryseobacterium indoltheticum TaxID=254 RepID=A0A381F3Z3_9FLAO|nr:large conductance mechanosensitive channel protein MscL [Chryseobacterium indoltheticum]AZA74841.1 large conductance mechanosensitive channel protein MscL [Chryseobacterium indoltheticum]MDF2832005.1 mscL [Chryseobacterium indoltheticum]SIQ33486.1 large conductance mechanosensitive channel [Chryseobacterium indoltheticum]SUX41280.1 Large-conductance mechanosensitive channel [Chryseobacterium indoltheticum]